MKTRVIAFWDMLRTSFWFVPTLMAVGAIGLAFVTLTLDQVVRDEMIETIGWVYTGGPEGARSLLSTVAGSVITVAGVIFSITIAALTLASTQFGPRLLRNFVRDTGNQVVLGTFIATFIYCLLVLRTVRGLDGITFVPHISVTGGVVLAIGSLGVLIYFIHHVALSIQAEQLISTVSHDLNSAIDRLFPERLGHDPIEFQPSPPKPDLPTDFDQEAQPVAATQTGYLQAINTDQLIEVAVEHDLILRLAYRPGHFIVRESDLVYVWPGKRIDEQLAAQINQAFILGVRRTPTQDTEFAINQLVEIAVRALSPGINDPFTAITCIDWLGAALYEIAGRVMPSPYRYDDEGHLRIIADPVTFAGMTDAAFDQIRQYGRSSAAVTIHLLETIEVVTKHTHRQEDREALMRQAHMIKVGSREGLPEQQDQQDVEMRYQEAMRTEIDS